MIRRVLEMKQGHKVYRLTRIALDELRVLGAKAVSIEHDLEWDLFFFCGAKSSGDTILDAATLYLTLRELFGPPDSNYDSWKCTFAFNFQIDALTNVSVARYILHVTDWKGAIEFRLYRHDDSSGRQARDRFHPFRDDEISRLDYRYIRSWFYGYLVGFHEAGVVSTDLDSFACIENVLLIYGVRRGRTFEKEFEDEDDYQREIGRLRRAGVPEGIDSLEARLVTD